MTHSALEEPLESYSACVILVFPLLDFIMVDICGNCITAEIHCLLNGLGFDSCFSLISASVSVSPPVFCYTHQSVTSLSLFLSLSVHV